MALTNLNPTSATLQVEDFTAAGAGTFTTKADVTEIEIELWGAGGAGGGGNGDAGIGGRGGAGGNGGGYVKTIYPVSPSTLYNFSIGAGGVINFSGNNGGNGGATTFNSVLRAPGGIGGFGASGPPPGGPANTDFFIDGVNQTLNGKGGTNSGSGDPGMRSFRAVAGTGGPNGGIHGGGGGGGGGFGDGGNGGTAGGPAGTAGTAAGGGGGSGNNVAGVAGSNGGNGMIRISYVSKF